MKIAIIGGGLAGVLTHFQLLKRGFYPILIHQSLPESASVAAAGIINPLTGPAFSKSWNYDQLLDYFVPFYKSLSNFIGYDVLQEIPFYRYLNTDQIKLWQHKKENPAYTRYCGEIIADKFYFHNQFKQKVKVNGAFRLNLLELLPRYLEKIRLIGLSENETFDYAACKPGEKEVSYKNTKFNKIIFAEGFRVEFNPFFNYLPILPNLGQAFIIPKEASPPDQLVKAKFLLSPWSKNESWYGATMYRMTNSLDFVDGSKELLNSYLHDFGKSLVDLVRLRGIRATVPDRRPLIGQHAQFPALYIINGLGTKGSSLAPWISAQLINFITDNRPIPGEIDIRRYDNKR